MRLRHLLPALVLPAILGAAGVRAGAEGPAPVPVKVVDGHLVVTCDLSTRHRRIPAALFVELENPCGLQLHNQAAGGLRAEEPDGTANPITIHLPGLPLVVPSREHGPERAWEDFTRRSSAALGEVAVVGTLGLRVLREHHLVLDLAAGSLTLAPPRPEGEPPPAPTPGTTDVTVSLVGDLVWLPVRFQDGTPAAMALGTARYDTWIDEGVARRRGHPAGDVGPLSVLGLDLARYVAFRPERVALAHPDGAVGVTGLGLLEHLRVEVDRVNRRVRLRETAPADFPQADLDFFRARAEDDGDAVEAWLDAHPSARLAGEGARLLLDLRLDEGADGAAVERAIQHVHDAAPEDLRASTMLDLMEVLVQTGHPEHLEAAGRLGIADGRTDRYPDAVARIHARLGAALLEAGSSREAWRHLLSAAFGLPEDGMVNLDLGRYYEQEGRLRRAFSRYVQAVIQPESGPQALEALERVQARLGGERFSVDLVERMIAGKVLSFGSASRWAAERGQDTGHVALVELFTNAHFEPALGGALANEGLLAHFPPDHVAFLSYHLPAPTLEPLADALAVETARQRRVPGPGIHLVDGVLPAPGAGRARDKEEIYAAARDVVVEALRARPEHALAIDASVAGRVVRGRVRVTGPARAGLVVHAVLAERGVLFPGRSKVVVHRMVARAALTPTAAGVPYAPREDGMVLSFEVDLDAVEAEHRRWLAEQEAAGAGHALAIGTRIDPAQLAVVAFLRDPATGLVLQAARLDVPAPSEDAR